MTKLVLALAGAAILGLTVSTSARENIVTTDQGVQVAATDVSAMHRRHHMRRHHVHRDRGLHRGFSHSRHLGYGKH